MVDNDAVSFHELRWDSEYFGVTCAKAILHRELSKIEWDELRGLFSDYQFISIENKNAIPNNAQFIGRNTTAFLADVNIQFKKKIESSCDLENSVQIYQAMKRDERVIELGDFQFSKFLEDPQLAKRGGADVYRHWLSNSFEKNEKFFAIAEGAGGELNGYLLYSYSDNVCIVELIAVSKNVAKSGIGTSLFKAVENAANKHGCDEIKVGTQFRNIRAINFYNKVGCKQVECHEVFHLWNL